MVQIISKHQALSFDSLIVMDTETGILEAFGVSLHQIIPKLRQT